MSNQLFVCLWVDGGRRGARGAQLIMSEPTGFSRTLANDEDLYALLLMDLSYVVALVDLILAFRNPRNVRLLLTTSRAYQQPASHSYAPCLCQSVARLLCPGLICGLILYVDAIRLPPCPSVEVSDLCSFPACHRSSPGSHCNLHCQLWFVRFDGLSSLDVSS